MKIRSRHKISAKFEMASMTDLVFLLLIFFMLITTMVVPNVNTLKLLLPSSDTAKPTENLSVSVAIDDKMQYYFDSKPVGLNQLENNVRSFVSANKNSVIVLHTANTVPIENVVSIMDICNRLKVKMVLATTPEK